MDSETRSASKWTGEQVHEVASFLIVEDFGGGRSVAAAARLALSAAARSAFRVVGDFGAGMLVAIEPDPQTPFPDPSEE